MFIAIATAVERHQNEKLIDIFNNVKNLRNARPAMVQTLVSWRRLLSADLDQELNRR